MKKLSGIGASGGISIGRVHIFQSTVLEATYSIAVDRSFEWMRFESARTQAIAALGRLFDRADRMVGPEESIIFKIHQMFLQDRDFVESIKCLILENGYTAEYAVYATGERLKTQFLHLDNAYLRARSADIIDVSNHILRGLSGRKAEDLMQLQGPLVLVAEDFLPSDTIQMDKSKVYAFISSVGSPDSHSVILARRMGIPAVVELGEQITQLQEAEQVLVNGDEGTVLLNPAPEMIQELYMGCVGAAK